MVSAEEPRKAGDTRRVLLWQALLTVILVGVAGASGRGSPASVVLGAALLGGSFLLQRWAASAALRARPRPALAVGLFLLKLGLLLALVLAGLGSSRVAPISLAAGATTLWLAILAETCYCARLSHGRDA